VLLPLVLFATLAAGCGGDSNAPYEQSDTNKLTATVGGTSRLIGSSSTCGDGAPRDVLLQCGIEAANPGAEPVPARPDAEIILQFEAKVGRLLVERKRAGGSGPIEEVTQLRPVPVPSDRTRWTIRAPTRLRGNTVLGLVALYEEPVRIRNLNTGGTVALDNTVIQFQVPLREAG